MHFRPRKNAIQLVRTTYDATTKRGRYATIGNVPKSSLALTDDVAAKLTPEEKQEFETFVTNYRNTTALQAKVYAFQFPEIVQQVFSAVDLVEGKDRDLILSNLSQAIFDIRAFIGRNAAK